MVLSRITKYLALHAYASLQLGLAMSGENPFHTEYKFTKATFFLPHRTRRGTVGRQQVTA